MPSLRQPCRMSAGIPERDASAMAMFVHLAPNSGLARIRRNGIARLRRPGGEFPGGLFAVPVTRNFFLSHQWLRELRRNSSGLISGVYFRIPDEEAVWVGHYGQPHHWMTAAEAVCAFSSAEDARGWEVVIPRRIEVDELHAIRKVPQVVGWRFSPSAKGKPPYCTCPFCIRGTYGARRLRERLGAPDDGRR